MVLQHCLVLQWSVARGAEDATVGRVGPCWPSLPGHWALRPGGGSGKRRFEERGFRGEGPYRQAAPPPLGCVVESCERGFSFVRTCVSFLCSSTASLRHHSFRHIGDVWRVVVSACVRTLCCGAQGARGRAAFGSIHPCWTQIPRAERTTPSTAPKLTVCLLIALWRARVFGHRGRRVTEEIPCSLWRLCGFIDREEPASGCRPVQWCVALHCMCSY